ncbi:MAG: AbrB family transcriptional regulator [Planctomycetes bacterium]|nr:AbrB family transcriptional regulator [Planctomycetota bacterium]
MLDMSCLRPAMRWIVLVVCSFALIWLLGWLSVPAHILLAAMMSGVLLSTRGGSVRLPKGIFVLAQGVIGSMIARSMTGAAFFEMIDHWAIMVVLVVSVTLVSTGLGWWLARTGALPGSTAIWGTSPGGALIMTVMSEDYGADSRLVAFMQYSRVILVTLVATIVAGIWGEVRTGGEQVVVLTALAGSAWSSYAVTFALALSGAAVSRFIRFSSAPMLVPLFLGSILNVLGLVELDLPGWVLAGAYVMIGWSIGLRFSAEILYHALSALPRILATLLGMIGICGVLSAVFGRLLGMDPITAYLATSPGGIDAIAILSMSIGGNMSFVMAAQTLRLIVVILAGPFLAAFVARKTGYLPRSGPTEKDK